MIQHQTAPPLSDLSNPSESAPFDDHDKSEKISNGALSSNGGDKGEEYPPMREVVPILLALGLAIFLNTLVSRFPPFPSPSVLVYQNTHIFRTSRIEVSLRPPFQKLQTSSTPLPMLAGMAVLTC
jgi:hypothetical protein